MSTQENNQTPISEANLAVWYQAMLNRYNSTSNANNTIDNKSSVILAVAAAIAVFGAERLANNIGVLGIAGMIGMVITIIVIIINTNLKSIVGEVNSTDDRPSYYWEEDRQFLLHLVSDLEASLSSLTENNKRKARLYKWSTIIFAVASGILLVSVFWDFNLLFQAINRS